MRVFTRPTGQTIDLDAVVSVGEVFVNKNYPEYNCYEVYLAGGDSFSLFTNDVARDEFIAKWGGAN